MMKERLELEVNKQIEKATNKFIIDLQKELISIGIPVKAIDSSFNVKVFFEDYFIKDINDTLSEKN